jgi:hypothetical protein
MAASTALVRARRSEPRNYRNGKTAPVEGPGPLPESRQVIADRRQV